MKEIRWGFSDREATVDDVLMHVGKGWHKLVEKLIEDLFELGWDGCLLQIKEKFGGLRFYIAEGSDAIFDRINEAEDESYQTCEVTGEPGELRSDLGWIKTLCEEEYQKEKRE